MIRTTTLASFAAVAAALCVAAGDARAQAAFEFHVTGVALDHEQRPVQGANVGASFTFDSCTPTGSCVVVTAGTWYQLSGADGRFDLTIAVPAQPHAYARNQKLVVSTFGSEASIVSKRSQAWNSDPGFWTIDVVLRNTPAQVSIDGGYWARRVGCGEYPVFVVEGFDPMDSTKTGDKADPKSWLGLLAQSKLDGSTNLLDYLTSHNYSLYVLSSGANSGNSIRADAAGDVTKGMAYQAVFLAKTVLEQDHPGKPLVIGGYSAGGLTSRVGLTKWCDGTYDGPSGGFLAAGCDAVSLWFSGDAPQKGATAPIAIQRYLHDDEIIGQITGVNAVQEMLDTPAAQEMLLRSIGDQVCNTNCGGSLTAPDLFGCESTDGDFMDECAVRTATHTSFMQWVGGYPTRAGGPVPAIAFSLGEAWRDASGAVPKPAYCWDAAANQGKKFFETKVDCWGNHNMYVNTAGGFDECVPGSVVNSLTDLDGLTGPNNKCVGGWEVDVPYAPTYISTDSAIDWDSRHTRWKDHYYADANLPHGGAIPSAAGGFLLAWIAEYTTGQQVAPPCDGRPAGMLLGKNQVCRATPGGSTETTLACPVAAEPLDAVVATKSYGSDTPAVGVLVTRNFGATSPTYTPANAGLTGGGLDVGGVELDPFDPDAAYIYTADGIYRNPKLWSGGAWTRILDQGQFQGAAGMTFPTGWAILHAVPSPTVQGRIHALVEGRNATEASIEKRHRWYAMVSHDGGASWSAQQVGQGGSSATGGATGGGSSITPSPTDPAKVWLTARASNYNGCVWFTSCSTVWRSGNGGTTWVEAVEMRFPYVRTTHLLMPALGGDDNRVGLRFRAPVGGNDPALNGTEDGFATVAWTTNPFTQTGQSWANYAHRPNSFYADPEKSGRIALLAKNVFLVSIDGGKHWILKTPPGIGNGDILERGTAPWKIAAASSYSAVWNPTLYTTIGYTTDGGATWQKRNGNLKTLTTTLNMSLSSVRIRR